MSRCALVFMVGLAGCPLRPTQPLEPAVHANPGLAYCALALDNQRVFEGGPTLSAAAITLCERYYADVDDPAQLEALACMAQAQDPEGWQVCRDQQPVPEVAVDSPVATRVMRQADLGPDPGVLGALRPELQGGIGGLIGADGAARPVGSVASEPIILGALDKDIIARIIGDNVESIRDCYQNFLKASPNLAGKLVVKFVIAKDGTVSSAVTKSSTLGSPEVEACINHAVMGFVFPEPRGGGIVIVSYPFLFSPE